MWIKFDTKSTGTATNLYEKLTSNPLRMTKRHRFSSLHRNACVNQILNPIKSYMNSLSKDENIVFKHEERRQ
jgi:hypothetical protein